MRHSWQRRIERAAELAARDATGAALLTEYRGLLGLQRDCYQTLGGRAETLTGAAEADLSILRACAARMIKDIPDRVAADLDVTDVDSILIDGWRGTSVSLLAKLVLQPYAERLVEANRPPSGRGRAGVNSACPRCGGPPQLSILQVPDAGGSGRLLYCAMCGTTWPARRLLCVSCGEEDERRLGYFHSPEFDHLRVDACDTCRHYVKTVDLTRLGVAVPVVDEVAGAALDLWARERGYEKVELNLVGL